MRQVEVEGVRINKGEVNGGRLAQTNFCFWRSGIHQCLQDLKPYVLAYIHNGLRRSTGNSSTSSSLVRRSSISVLQVQYPITYVCVCVCVLRNCPSPPLFHLSLSLSFRGAMCLHFGLFSPLCVCMCVRIVFSFAV